MSNLLAPRHLANNEDWLRSYYDLFAFAATQSRLPQLPAASAREVLLAGWARQQRVLHSTGSEVLTRKRARLLERIPEWNWMDY